LAALLTTKARITAIPEQLAGDLVGETSRVMVQAKLERAIREALRDLARSGAKDSGEGATQIEVNAMMPS
jgi:hypothetical protein